MGGSNALFIAVISRLFVIVSLAKNRPTKTDLQQTNDAMNEGSSEGLTLF